MTTSIFNTIKWWPVYESWIVKTLSCYKHILQILLSRILKRTLTHINIQQKVELLHSYSLKWHPFVFHSSRDIIISFLGRFSSWENHPATTFYWFIEFLITSKRDYNPYYTYFCLLFDYTPLWSPFPGIPLDPRPSKIATLCAPAKRRRQNQKCSKFPSVMVIYASHILSLYTQWLLCFTGLQLR